MSSSNKVEELLNQTMEKAGTGLSDEEISQLAGQIQDLKELLDNPPYNLTHWEYEFIENVAISYESLRVLSEKQRDNIDRLYVKFCT